MGAAVFFIMKGIINRKKKSKKTGVNEDGKLDLVSRRF